MKEIIGCGGIVVNLDDYNNDGGYPPLTRSE